MSSSPTRSESPELLEREGRKNTEAASGILGSLEADSFKEPSQHQRRWDYLNSLELSDPPMIGMGGNNSNNSNILVVEEEDDYQEKPLRERPAWIGTCQQGFQKHHRIIYIAAAVALSMIGASIFFSTNGSRSAASGSRGGDGTVTMESNYFLYNDQIPITVTTSKKASDLWVGIWHEKDAPGTVYTVSDVPSAMWISLCELDDHACLSKKTHTVTFSSSTDWDSDLEISWPLCNGKWTACLIDADDNNLGCSEDFFVNGGSCTGLCRPASGDLSELHHAQPKEGTPLTKIAFGSNFAPGNQVDDTLWKHVRETFQPDLWVWLGNFINAEGENLQHKRDAYNLNKHDTFYSQMGPLAEPQIPVAATWNDYDAGNDNGGAEYQCYADSQQEFAYWLNVDEDDPRHPSQGDAVQKGVYSSNMFTTPDGSSNGVHLILLDVRTFRSPTFEDKGYCEGDESTMLGDDQWNWFQMELDRPSEIKIIGTGLQVLQPTDQVENKATDYCAHADNFQQAIRALGEDQNWLGTQFESWGQLPVERAKLLMLVQRAINEGKAKKVIFISGDMLWGSVAAKNIPENQFGAAQTVFEVTSSGIDMSWPYANPNANRLKVRSADSSGEGPYQNECVFPFFYQGKEYRECTDVGEEKPWCALQVDDKFEMVDGQWGYCRPIEEELVPAANITYSGENSCDQSMHICKARANYGGIEVDWDNRYIDLDIFTPHSNVDPREARVRIGF